jgi:hypothetical protein
MPDPTPPPPPPPGRPVSTLLAIRARLVAAGYTTFLGRVVDPNQDTLPLVTIGYASDGDMTIKDRPERIGELQIVVEYWAKTATDDPILELIPFGEALRVALTQHDDDRLDRLGGTADSITHEKTIIDIRPDYDEIGVAHCVFRIRY